MTYCKQEGKDQIIFARHEDLEKPSSALIRQDEEEEEAGLILPSGEINWNCPCLGGMASGPCGVSFREAFSCFHFSKEDPKGSECYQQFRSMQECMTNYPELYQENNKAESNVNSGDIKENVINVEAPNVQIQTPEKR